MSMAVYTDTHAHLGYVLERQGQEVLDEISKAYSGSDARILDPGVEPDDFPRRKAAFSKYPFVRLAAGIWPDARFLESPDNCLSRLESYIADDACIAVGECGLDYHWMHGSVEQQASLFNAQIALALAYQKPLLVHSRKAHDDTLHLVTDAASRIPVVIHCFGYGEAELSDYLAAGCYISFAGNVSYKNSRDLHAAAAGVSLDRLLVETDAPYMNPEPMRGKPSSPLDIQRTYDCIARLKGVTSTELHASVQKNAKEIFGQRW